MKYIVRLNPKAFNPITHKVEPSRVWEIEQCADRDSEKVIWHCADVRINNTPICEIFVLPKPGEEPFERTYFGICVRGQDNAIEIKEGRHDV
jgi:hypothetical protein